jgi:hypothetical protein
MFKRVLTDKEFDKFLTLNTKIQIDKFFKVLDLLK